MAKVAIVLQVFRRRVFQRLGAGSLGPEWLRINPHHQVELGAADGFHQPVGAIPIVHLFDSFDVTPGNMLDQESPCPGLV
jgi:hypothetical protein